MASNASNTGGYDCKFVDAPPDKLVCQICLFVSGTPHQMTCCGRVYCKACLNQHKKCSRACPNCRKRGQDFPDTRGEQEIKALKVMCSNGENGCGWVGELRSLGYHLTICGYTFLCCPNECMKNKKKGRILRRDLENHLKNECPNRQYQCPHCEAIGRHCDITTTHLATCPKVKIPCPNNGCKALVTRCDFSDHQSTCQYEKVSCKYAGIGCNKELLRKDLQQHESDDSLHLHLVIETVNDKQVKERSCTVKVPGLKQSRYYTPSFYIYPGGYKMCIRVDANGDDSAGAHVSVFAYLMKGKNDDNLPWPFTEEVTITLLNQLEDENHYTRTISFPPDNEASRRVVRGERASTGYGFPQFISHDKLHFDAALNRQYLKDDCLYFRIEVQTAKPTKPWLTCMV